MIQYEFSDEFMRVLDMSLIYTEVDMKLFTLESRRRRALGINRFGNTLTIRTERGIKHTINYLIEIAEITNYTWSISLNGVNLMAPSRYIPFYCFTLNGPYFLFRLCHPTKRFNIGWRSSPFLLRLLTAMRFNWFCRFWPELVHQSKLDNGFGSDKTIDTRSQVSVGSIPYSSVDLKPMIWLRFDLVGTKGLMRSLSKILRFHLMLHRTAELTPIKTQYWVCVWLFRRSKPFKSTLVYRVWFGRSFTLLLQ